MPALPAGLRHHLGSKQNLRKLRAGRRLVGAVDGVIRSNLADVGKGWAAGATWVADRRVYPFGSVGTRQPVETSTKGDHHAATARAKRHEEERAAA
jgi:hypothetical protein